MKKTLVNKKYAFTLIEVILALLIASMASMYVINSMSNSKFNSAIKEMQNTIEDIVNKGIISTSGYASGSGGFCSSDYDFTTLSTLRLTQCLDWNNTRFDIDDSDALAPLTGIGFMRNYGKCQFNAVVDATNTRKFDIYIDCSNVVYDSKTLERLEEAIQFVFEQRLNDIHVQTLRDADDLSGTTTGNNTDGKIMGRFEL